MRASKKGVEIGRKVQEKIILSPRFARYAIAEEYGFHMSSYLRHEPAMVAGCNHSI